MKLRKQIYEKGIARAQTVAQISIPSVRIRLNRGTYDWLGGLAGLQESPLHVSYSFYQRTAYQPNSSQNRVVGGGPPGLPRFVSGPNKFDPATRSMICREMGSFRVFFYGVLSFAGVFASFIRRNGEIRQTFPVYLLTYGNDLAISGGLMGIL